MVEDVWCFGGGGGCGEREDPRRGASFTLALNAPTYGTHCLHGTTQPRPAGSLSAAASARRRLLRSGLRRPRDDRRALGLRAFSALSGLCGAGAARERRSRPTSRRRVCASARRPAAVEGGLRELQARWRSACRLEASSMRKWPQPDANCTPHWLCRPSRWVLFLEHQRPTTRERLR